MSSKTKRLLVVIGAIAMILVFSVFSSDSPPKLEAQTSGSYYAFSDGMVRCDNGAVTHFRFTARTNIAVGDEISISTQLRLIDGTLNPVSNYTYTATQSSTSDAIHDWSEHPIAGSISSHWEQYEVSRGRQLISSSSWLLECPAGFTGELEAATTYNGPPLPPFPQETTGDSAIERERQAGIERVFDDGIVVARQPNGDYHFYSSEGCFIGSATNQFLDDADLAYNENLLSLNGCGFTVNIDATGYPACSVVLNMYGANNYSKTHWLEETFNGRTACATSGNPDGDDFTFIPCSRHSNLDGCVNTNPGVSLQDADVVLINGVRNTSDSNDSSRMLVETELPGDVAGIYNGGLLQNSGNTEVFSNAAQTLINFLISTSHPVTLIGHSQGGIVIADALQYVASSQPSRLSNITVYTFGSPALNYPSGPHYKHCTFYYDPTTSVSRFAVSNYTILPRIIDFGNPIANHDFENYMLFWGACTG